MQITKITPEQKARFAEWREKWIRIGLSTEPADFEKAEKAALRVYKLNNCERPKTILRVGSPYAATLVAMKRYEDIYRVDRNPRRFLLRLMWTLGERARDPILNYVNERISGKVDSEVRELVDMRVSNRVERQVGWMVRDQVLLQIDRLFKNFNWVFSRGYRRNSLGGSFWCDWCSHITYLRDVLGLQDRSLKRFSIEEDLVTSCGWIWWDEDVLVIGDRPSEIHLDEEGLLHNEKGPSIAYRDGWKLYHIHGVAVPDFVVERPETITVEHIKSESNAEVRRVMISRMGLERFIRESGLKPVHSDDFGTLYRKKMPDDEPLVVVKVVNSTPNPDGSCKEYFLRVPPTMKRAREAVAWTFGMKEKEYLPATET